MLRRMQIWASSDVLESFVDASVFNKGWNLQQKRKQSYTWLQNKILYMINITTYLKWPK